MVPYVGEMHHGGKWFEGEHAAIVDRATFDRVQQLLATKASGRKVKRSESGALLAGKHYDDKGNRMSPSFSSKNGVRYRFYVSSALLQRRKEAAGSVNRVAATEIESAVLTALKADRKDRRMDDDATTIEMLERVVIGRHQLQIKVAACAHADNAAREIRIARSSEMKGTSTLLSKITLGHTDDEVR
jgi:site-specific DNA recombinase